MELDNHVEDLASDLGIDKEEVRSDLQILVEYSVPVDEAKQSLRRKYGDGSSGGGTPSAKNVADITPDDGNVTVTGVVLTAGKRSIRCRDPSARSASVPTRRRWMSAKPSERVASTTSNSSAT